MVVDWFIEKSAFWGLDSTQVTQAFFGGRCAFESLLEDGLDRFGHIKFFSEFTYDKNCFKCLAVCLRNYCTSLKSQVISLLLFFLLSKVIYIYRYQMLISAIQSGIKSVQKESHMRQ